MPCFMEIIWVAIYEMKLPVLLVKTQSFVSFQEIGVQMYTYKAGQRA